MRLGGASAETSDGVFGRWEMGDGKWEMDNATEAGEVMWRPPTRLRVGTRLCHKYAGQQTSPGVGEHLAKQETRGGRSQAKCVDAGRATSSNVWDRKKEIAETMNLGTCIK